MTCFMALKSAGDVLFVGAAIRVIAGARPRRSCPQFVVVGLAAALGSGALSILITGAYQSDRLTRFTAQDCSGRHVAMLDYWRAGRRTQEVTPCDQFRDVVGGALQEKLVPAVSVKPADAKLLAGLRCPRSQPVPRHEKVTQTRRVLR
jgi:hypothetical protein